MNYNNIRNCNQRQFDAVMKRECIAVTDYYDSGKSYNVFFRRNNKGTTPQGKLRFYYAQDTSIAIGTIFTLKGIHYLVTSQDANESDVYHTSIAVRCDTALNVPVNTGGVVTVPCVTIKNEYTLWRNIFICLNRKKFSELFKKNRIIEYIGGCNFATYLSKRK